ncbi:geranylgeranyl diphosphate synthase, type II [Atopostipes suicloacalis DSM 15692]|uniref:Farnesyl diphosphate synthase n=1 Tax=Atopostipes suicloacalis DSM 15692 TaxID=1121025 RepID=A0A1M4TQW6_9LACT|nr:farnesyl diphosphate synthase [Atopostipes suicloacalis]SHE46851.1 geranylgeranyl diphosphate synthase, type II [Atopostipes suicloacalis DSM 15692]
MEFKAFTEKYLNDFNTYLLNHIENKSNTSLEDAMNYSLDANGKRLRPLLLLAVLESFHLPIKSGYEAAAALEMVHTYSLIHDDLPAMDNDDLRRGKPTNHIQFNEATAILAGDALLTLAFEVLTKGNLASEIKLALIQKLAKTSGYEGMVGGQQADIDGEKKRLTIEDIERIHFRKTGALIEMATVSGGIIAKKSEPILKKLANLANEIGIAYQIRDDILDVVASEEELGKGVATDAALEKSTYPSLLGIEESFLRLNQRLKKAEQIILSIAEMDEPFQTDLLISFVHQLSLEEYK